MKKRKMKLQQFAYGGNYGYAPWDTALQQRLNSQPAYLDSPDSALARADIREAKAMEAGASNPWGIGLDIAGGVLGFAGNALMSKGLSNPTTALDKKIAGSNLGSLGVQGLGMILPALQTGIGLMAHGGMVGGMAPVEVEGEEMAEMPNGQMMQFEGPSHEGGGIPVNLPIGTEVFSKRIKIDGKTMAQRKKDRESTEARLQKKLDKDPDAILKNSLNRVQSINAIEDQKDKSIQAILSGGQVPDMQQQPIMQQPMPMMAGGGPVVGGYSINDPNFYAKWSKKINDASPILPSIGDFYNSQRKEFTPGFGLDYTNLPVNLPDTQIPLETQSFIDKYKSPTTMSPISTTFSTAFDTDRDLANYSRKGEWKKGLKEKTREKTKWPDFIGQGVTPGDILGLAGNLYQGIKTRQNVLRNRSGDMPNVNTFTDYGKKSLNTLERNKEYVNQQRDLANREIDRQMQTAMATARGSAQSANTMRALDLAAYLGAQQAVNSNYANATNAYTGINDKIAALQSDIDTKVMSGENARIQANQLDRDNFFNQLTMADQSIGRLVSESGKFANQVKANNYKWKAMNELGNYLRRNPLTGDLEMRDDAGHFTVIKPNPPHSSPDTLSPEEIAGFRKYQAYMNSIEKANK